MRPEDLVTTQEACRILRISRPTLYSWITQRKLKPWGQFGGHEAWFFLRSELLKARGMKYRRIRVAA